MTTALTPPVTEHDHRIGPANAPVTLVEYGDYECPYCGMAFPIVNAVMRQMNDTLQFAFRQFPLSRAHPHAEHAAEMAEAAASGHKFWFMHGLLYQNQAALEDEDLVGYANALEMDAQWAAAALASHRFADRVREHFISGVRSGVIGTPTFYINGARHDGAWDEPALLAALRGALPVGARQE